jgi:NitT/TauT family transport system permease protein
MIRVRAFQLALVGGAIVALEALCRAGIIDRFTMVMTARARLLDYVLLAGGLWLAWILLFQWAGPEALSPPGATLRRVGEYLTSAQFWPHVAATGVAFAYACVIALVGGLALGFVLGANRLAGQVGEPILSSLYSIPKITLYPVILLVFGLGISAKVAFGALHGLFPVALFTIGALKNTSPVLIKTARVLRLAPLATARTVLLPAALPEIVTGLRIGFSATLLGTLIGELFASDQGLGFMLIRAMEAHKVLDIMALTLLLFAFAAAANKLLLAVERRMRRR